jgi:ribosomal protein L18
VAVSRSNKNITAQIIDDLAGNTLVAASSVETAVTVSGVSVHAATLSLQRLLPLGAG